MIFEYSFIPGFNISWVGFFVSIFFGETLNFFLLPFIYKYIILQLLCLLSKLVLKKLIPLFTHDNGIFFWYQDEMELESVI